MHDRMYTIICLISCFLSSLHLFIFFSFSNIFFFASLSYLQSSSLPCFLSGLVRFPSLVYVFSEAVPSSHCWLASNVVDLIWWLVFTLSSRLDGSKPVCVMCVQRFPASGGSLPPLSPGAQIPAGHWVLLCRAHIQSRMGRGHISTRGSAPLCSSTRMCTAL